jgi:hypothetical protein
MTSRRIALIGYPTEYFVPFAAALEQAGFAVYWVCALHADAKHLQQKAVPAARILDIAQSFRPGTHSESQCRAGLAQFENETDPKFNDIILMDRLVCEKDWRFSIEFLYHVATSISAFLTLNQISLVSSWRDTSVQMTALLVARKLGIPFVIPTRIRIPQEVYGFCTAHHTESFLRLRPPTTEHYAWAEKFLSDFESRGVKPALKKSTRSFVDVLRLLPSHFNAFRYEVRRSFSDRGNDYTRYAIATLIRMYLRRRLNLARYKMFNPSQTRLPQDQPFCLYALHTQPESSIDVQGSYFSNQLELIRHIARSIPSSHVLYVKVHPTDLDGKSMRFYRSIKQIPSVVLVDYSVDSRSLLDRASIIFALTGTIAYEAGLMEKPVIVFAKNFFNALPTVHRCDAPTELRPLVSRLLSDAGPTKGRREEIVSFLTNIRTSCFDGEVSRTYGASNELLSPSDLRQLQVAYNTVHDFLVKDCRP